MNGKNNQDALCCRADNGVLIAVVCDGCSSGRYSEVGARLGARLLAESLRRNLQAQPDAPTSLWEAVRQDVLSGLLQLALSMGGNLADTVHDHFLFTIVGTVISPARTVVFALGDGVAGVNGELLCLGPYPDNSPPYLGYALDQGTAALFAPDALQFQIVRSVETPAVRSVLIGTDGTVDLARAVSLRELWDSDRYFKNPDMLRRRLVLAGKEPGALPDDTTLVVIRRKPER